MSIRTPITKPKCFGRYNEESCKSCILISNCRTEKAIEDHPIDNGSIFNIVNVFLISLCCFLIAMITFFGITFIVNDWVADFGISPSIDEINSLIFQLCLEFPYCVIFSICIIIPIFSFIMMEIQEFKEK